MNRNQNKIDAAALYETSDIIASTYELSDLLDKILGLAARALQASKGLVLLYNTVTNKLDVNSIYGKYKKLPCYFDSDKGLGGYILKHKQPVLINDLKNSALYKKTALQGYETTTMLAVSLCLKKEVAGFILLGDKTKKAGGEFTLNDQNLLEAITKQTAVAMANALCRREAVSKERLERKYFRL